MADQSTATPQDLPGVWRRDLLVAGDVHDERTMVLWFQAPSLFADIRLPAFGDAGAKPEGFAGRTEMARNGDAVRVAWERMIDIAPTGTEDVGDMRWVGEGRQRRLREDGVKADYYEIWRRDATFGEGDVALRLAGPSPEQAAILVRVGAQALLALGGESPSVSLLDMVNAPGAVLRSTDKALETRTVLNAATLQTDDVALMLGGAPEGWTVVERESVSVEASS